MITIYSKNNCMQCEFTKRELKENDVEFVELNVDTDEELYKKVKAISVETGYSSFPLVMKDGQVIASGFQPDRLSSLYA